MKCCYGSDDSRRTTRISSEIVRFMLLWAIVERLHFTDSFAPNTLLVSSSSFSRDRGPGHRGVPALIPSARGGQTHGNLDFGEEAVKSNGATTATNSNGSGDYPSRKDSSFFRTTPLDRRSWVSSVVLSTGSSAVAFSAAVAAATEESTATAVPPKVSGNLSDGILQSLVFEKILGSGSYKTVYLVRAAIPAPTASSSPAKQQTVRYALAVERLRTKREVKNAVRGVRVPEQLRQNVLSNHPSGNRNDGDGDDDDADLFERILDWWFQPSGLPDFAPGARVFPSAIPKRTRSEPPKNFAGSRWMLSFKPVYEVDFKKFISRHPVPVPATGTPTAAASSNGGETDDYWTEPVLLAFVLDVLRAGRLMHEAGIVHRDIKPKNLMIRAVPSSSSSSSPPGRSVKRPVIIDYGYADFGSPLQLEADDTKTRDLCVVRTGNLKGEVDYVLAEDLERYRGCQRGDAYAMGKTLYEFVFGSSSDLQQQQQDDDDDDVPISIEGAVLRNKAFRDRLVAATAEPRTVASRFPLSDRAAECLLEIIGGLCGTVLSDGATVLSFADGEAILSEYISRQQPRFQSPADAD